MLRIDYQSVWQTVPREGGFFGVQPDYYGEGNAGGRDLEIILPFGLFGRPADAEVDESAQVKVAANTLVLSDGSSEAFALPCGDPRFVQFAPDPGKGGGGLAYGVTDGDYKGAAYLMFAGAGIDTPAGSVKIDVPYSQGALHHSFEMTAGDKITIRHGSGTVFEMNDAGVKITRGTVVFEFTDTGVKITGGNIELGGSGGNKVMVDNGFVDWINNELRVKLATLALAVSPPPAITADKATAT
jgi:hypothetical protein